MISVRGLLTGALLVLTLVLDSQWQSRDTRRSRAPDRKGLQDLVR